MEQWSITLRLDVIYKLVAYFFYNRNDRIMHFTSTYVVIFAEGNPGIRIRKIAGIPGSISGLNPGIER